MCDSSRGQHLLKHSKYKVPGHHNFQLLMVRVRVRVLRRVKNHSLSSNSNVELATRSL